MVKIKIVLQMTTTYAACLLILVGVCTSEWSVFHKIIVLGKLRASAGLFRQCVDDECGELVASDRYAKEGLATSLVLAGTVVALVSATCITVQYIKRNDSQQTLETLSKVTLGVSVLGAMFIIGGCLLYAHHVFTTFVKPGYSFYCTFIGSLCLSLSGSLSQ